MGAAKAVANVKGHRTKKEKELRTEEEKKSASGTVLSEFAEVKKNKIAHKEFKRLEKLFKAIEKNDALFSAVVNRYCLMRAEAAEFEFNINRLRKRLTELSEAFEGGLLPAEMYFQQADKIQRLLLSYDKQLMTKRKMLLDIEKENGMTVAAGVRMIPKTSGQKDENPLLKALEE